MAKTKALKIEYDFVVNTIETIIREVDTSTNLKEIINVFLALSKLSLDLKDERPEVFEFSFQMLLTFSIVLHKTNSLDIDIIKGILINDMECILTQLNKKTESTDEDISMIFKI